MAVCWLQLKNPSHVSRRRSTVSCSCYTPLYFIADYTRRVSAMTPTSSRPNNSPCRLSLTDLYRKVVPSYYGIASTPHHHEESSTPRSDDILPAYQRVTLTDDRCNKLFYVSIHARFFFTFSTFLKFCPVFYFKKTFIKIFIKNSEKHRWNHKKIGLPHTFQK